MTNERSIEELLVPYTSKEKCCGCSACFAICPKNAIAMIENEEGFEYPIIDLKKCIHCHKCEHVCPIRTQLV